MQIIPHLTEALMVGFSFETCFLDPLVVLPRKWTLAQQLIVRTFIFLVWLAALWFFAFSKFYV